MSNFQVHYLMGDTDFPMLVSLVHLHLKMLRERGGGKKGELWLWTVWQLVVTANNQYLNKHSQIAFGYD
jgi:hypothetical protein